MDDGFNSLVKKADETLDKVLEFYKSQNITLSYRPKIEYFNSDKTANPAFIISEITPDYEMVSSYPKELIKYIVSTFGVNSVKFESRLEKMIKTEYQKIKKNGKVLIQKNKLDNKRIYITNTFPKNDEEVYYLLAHEVWHLIENEKVLKITPFISEGTATYAANVASGINKKISEDKIDNVDRFIYFGVSNIIYNYMNNSQLSNLLDKNIRDEIQKETRPAFNLFAVKIIKEQPRIREFKEKLTKNGAEITPDNIKNSKLLKKNIKKYDLNLDTFAKFLNIN